MKTLFAHDHRFIRYSESIYTKGGLPYSALSNYLLFSDSLLVVARCSSAGSVDHSKLQSSSGSRVYFFFVDNVRSFLGILKLPKVVNNIFKQVKYVDLVICRLPSSIGVIAWFAARFYKKKLVVEVVGNAFDANTMHGHKLGLFFGCIEHFFTKKIVRHSKNVIYITKEYLQSVYPTLGSSVVCPNVFIEKIAPYNKDFVYNKFNNDTVYIGLIGSLNVNYKGHEEAIFALADLIKKEKIKKIKIQFVGGGDKERWQALVSKLGLSQNVEFIGVLDRESLFSWLQSLNILVQPSLVEAQGRSIIEGMSQGLPVVSTKVGGIVELIDEKFLCEPRDHYCLSEKIFDLINNEEVYIGNSFRNYLESKEYIASSIEYNRVNFFKKVIDE